MESERLERERDRGSDNPDVTEDTVLTCFSKGNHVFRRQPRVSGTEKMSFDGTVNGIEKHLTTEPTATFG